MMISQPEHGGNGESRGVVNQWLRKSVVGKHQSGPIFDLVGESLWLCAPACRSVAAGA